MRTSEACFTPSSDPGGTDFQGGPMSSPHPIDPKLLKRRTAQSQEEKLVTLKDDSTHPPPTIGTPSWMSILGGPALGQPASGQRTFDHATEPFLFSGRFWLLILFAGFALYLLKTALIG